MTRPLVLALLLLVALASSAEGELEPLLSKGELTLHSAVSPASGLVPGQRAALVIEVATSTWFTGGTRIRIPEVPGLVILQTEQFAANTSETRGGRTFVVQRWTLDLYPQRAGEFSLPPIELSIQVNGGEGGSVAGTATAPPASFVVEVPAALSQADSWVASPRFSVAQRLDRSTDALAPGDAFERVIEFSADDVLAMMLPDFSEERLPGLAAYPAPPELDNRSNRGQASARRVQRISYVAEKPGRYLLPAQDFFWWDTRSEQLRVLGLEAVEVQVSGEARATGTAGRRLDRGRVLAGLGALAGAVVLGLALWRYRPWRLLAALGPPLRRARRRLADLRRPALPQRLNPGSSAGD